MTPLVYLPFEPADLGEPPEGLRYEVFDGVTIPDSIEEVEFYVPPYSLSAEAVGVIARMTSLEVVQTLTAGVDHIRPHLPEGVVLCNGRGIHDTATAELAVSLVLAAQNDLPRFLEAQLEGTFRVAWRRGLADSRVLIVGYGQIGAAIEARLTPFEVEITRVARTARPGVHGWDELGSLVPTADVVVLIVPGTDETRGLVDAEFLARMKDGALLVNMARGPVVETDALIAELGAGRLRAALDVTDPEPLPDGHPLWSTPGVIITPHVGGASAAMWPRAHRLVREQLVRYAAGDELVNQTTGAY